MLCSQVLELTLKTSANMRLCRRHTQMPPGKCWRGLEPASVACSTKRSKTAASSWLAGAPRASSQREDAKPETVRLSVQADGTYYWNESKVTDEALPGLLRTEAARNPQPDLHIRGDKAVRYERVAQALSAAQQAGLRKIGFITEPKP